MSMVKNSIRLCLTVFWGTSDLCAKSVEEALKVFIKVLFSITDINCKHFLEILTNEVGTSIIQLEDTLNLPESNKLKTLLFSYSFLIDHNCVCPYCSHTLCNLLETKNFISTYNMEEKNAMDQNNTSAFDMTEEKKDNS